MLCKYSRSYSIYTEKPGRVKSATGLWSANRFGKDSHGVPAEFFDDEKGKNIRVVAVFNIEGQRANAHAVVQCDHEGRLTVPTAGLVGKRVLKGSYTFGMVWGIY